MTQKDKELLLKDLSARLPYGVIVKVSDKNDPSYDMRGVLYKASNIDSDCNGTPFLFGVDGEGCLCDITEVKPYLRPISSMTETERVEYDNMFYKDEEGASICNNDDWFDFMNSHHFDYRGLIEKNLALEAPERMYDIKEK